MPNTQTVLERLRRLVEEVDQVTSTLTDEELLRTLGDARDSLQLRQIGGMSDLTVQPDQSLANYGIKPDPTLEQAEMLALMAASELLSREYRARVFRGELGAQWSSGFESESTITAARMYSDAIQKLRSDLEILVLLKFAPTTGTRPQ